MKGRPGDMLSTADGTNPTFEPPRFRLMSAASMTDTPVTVSASAADGSFSRGTCSPAIETDSASQARVQLQRARERSALHERAPRVRDSEKPRCSISSRVMRARIWWRSCPA